MRLLFSTILNSSCQINPIKLIGCISDENLLLLEMTGLTLSR
jgi:hypothetical protein